MHISQSRRPAVLGIDIGTSSCRAVVIDLADGDILAEGVSGYRSGSGGVITDPAMRGLARQEPRDYRTALIAAVRACRPGAAEILAIGVDSTGSSVLPVDARGRALVESDRFAANPNAQVWLWKDHTAQHEAARLTAAAQRLAPQVLRANGGARYSPENIWAKVLHCEAVDPVVADAAASWLEVCDYVVGHVLVGIDNLGDMPRAMSAAAHKGLYGGPASVEPVETVLASLSGRVAAQWRAAYRAPRQLTDIAGGLHPGIAAATGLDAGLPVAVGNLDAHSAALGAGIDIRTMAKVMGTSGSDLILLPPRGDDSIPEIAGACGAGRDSIVPNSIGIEFGMPAIGDAFAWAAGVFAGAGRADVAALAAAAEAVPPGSRGVVALDWLNGNRSTLQAPGLSGVLAGITLQTTPAEIFRALVESIAMSSRRIWEHARAATPALDAVAVTGGIPHRAPFVTQMLADVLQRDVQVTSSEHGSAVGAAIAAAVAAGYYSDVAEAQARLVRFRPVPHRPRAELGKRYDDLYGLWTELHDLMSATTNGQPPVLERLHRASAGT
jgi:L-ribulokinase